MEYPIQVIKGKRYCAADDVERYNIVRIYLGGGGHRRIIRRLVTLQAAQAHYNDPETSSGTATGARAQARTRRMGPWFDGYERAK